MNESTDLIAVEPPVRVVTKGLDASELAAVTVVVEAAGQQELDELRAEPIVSQTAWQRSQRTMRSPLQPGAGAWRAFSG